VILFVPYDVLICTALPLKFRNNDYCSWKPKEQRVPSGIHVVSKNI